MDVALITVHTVEDEKGTGLFAKKLTEILQVGDTLLLYGDLGSGKTFLIRAIMKEMGMVNVVSSPSFSILNQYYRMDLTINHIDLYRIKDVKELSNLGLDDFWEGPYINFIEWPQVIEQIIEWPHYRIEIETNHNSETWRRFGLKYVKPGY